MWNQRAGWWEIGPSGHAELKVRGAFKGELTPGPFVPACLIETIVTTWHGVIHLSGS